MGYILTTIGEEFVVTSNTDGVTLTVGLYNDSSDGISDGDDLDAIGSEPTNGNYSRVSDTFNAKNVNGNWAFSNSTELSYDFSDQSTSQTIDGYFVVANFESTETGDSGASDHLILTGELQASRDIGAINQLSISIDGVGTAVE